MACPGLTAAALPHSSAANFHQLCRVVGGKWSKVSAGILFDLCRNLPKDDAQAALAFQQIMAAANTPDAADIIIRAASTHKSYGSFAADDPKTAGLIHRAAETINKQRGGLYEGKMDCVRATICDPRLGITQHGMCLGCAAIRPDRAFLKRLQSRKAACADQPERKVASHVRKDTMTVDELIPRTCMDIPK